MYSICSWNKIFKVFFFFPYSRYTHLVLRIFSSHYYSNHSLKIMFKKNNQRFLKKDCYQAVWEKNNCKEEKGMIGENEFCLPVFLQLRNYIPVHIIFSYQVEFVRLAACWLAVKDTPNKNKVHFLVHSLTIVSPSYATAYACIFLVIDNKFLFVVPT